MGKFTKFLRRLLPCIKKKKVKAQSDRTEIDEIEWIREDSESENSIYDNNEEAFQNFDELLENGKGDTFELRDKQEKTKEFDEEVALEETEAIFEEIPLIDMQKVDSNGMEKKEDTMDEMENVVDEDMNDNIENIIDEIILNIIDEEVMKDEKDMDNENKNMDDEIRKANDEKDMKDEKGVYDEKDMDDKIRNIIDEIIMDAIGEKDMDDEKEMIDDKDMNDKIENFIDEIIMGMIGEKDINDGKNLNHKKNTIDENEKDTNDENDTIEEKDTIEEDDTIDETQLRDNRNHMVKCNEQVKDNNEETIFYVYEDEMTHNYYLELLMSNRVPFFYKELMKHFYHKKERKYQIEDRILSRYHKELLRHEQNEKNMTFNCITIVPSNYSSSEDDKRKELNETSQVNERNSDYGSGENCYKTCMFNMLNELLIFGICSVFCELIGE